MTANNTSKPNKPPFKEPGDKGYEDFKDYIFIAMLKKSFGADKGKVELFEKAVASVYHDILHGKKPGALFGHPWIQVIP